MPPVHDMPKAPNGPAAVIGEAEVELRVRRMHRRDINRVWEFLKLVFRDVNRETVEYQRPRHKKHFMEIYEEEGIEQLIFEIKRAGRFELVGYSEYAYEIVGSDSWMNHRYFEKRGMRPLFVEEIAVHPNYHEMGIGSFMFEQIEHAARLGAAPTSCSRSPRTTRRRCASTANAISRSSMPPSSSRASSTRADDLLSPRKLKPRAKPEGA